MTVSGRIPLVGNARDLQNTRNRLYMRRFRQTEKYKQNEKTKERKEYKNQWARDKRKQGNKKMNDIIIIDYTNWRGERRERKITPTGMKFTSNEWHPELQWMIVAIDEEDGMIKTFPLLNIHGFKKTDGKA